MRRRSIRLGAAGLLALLAVFLLSTVFHPLALTLASGDGVTKPRQQSELARLSDQVSVRAAGRGNPTINLSDGREVLTAYEGPQELQQVLLQNQAQPLSLASADFDEDGVPDLISGYGYEGRGIVTLLRGNVDAIYPNAPEAQHRKANGTLTNAPFLSPARVFALPVAADFVGAGDFDSDGHWDVVVASRTTKTLYLLSGDGRGGFASPREIVLPGVVTAMTIGEINRADGLTDLVIGVTGERSSQVLVFEGPEGALRADPEVFELKAAALSLALGQLDSEYTIDLAVAAGSDLLIVHGRDRKLSLDEGLRAKVPSAVSSSRIFDTPIRSIALGRFTDDDAQSIAVLGDDGVHILTQPKAENGQHAEAEISGWKSHSIFVRAGLADLISAHVSSFAHDDLLVLDEANKQLRILTTGGKATDNNAASIPSGSDVSFDLASQPVAVLPLRLNADALSDLVVLSSDQSSAAVLTNQPEATFVVTNTNASGPGSLQFAILDANDTPGADLITFNIPGGGTHTINLGTLPLPTVTDSVTIDGTTQPDFAGTPLIEVKGAAGMHVDGLVFTAGNSVIRGLVMNEFRYAIFFQQGGANFVEGNYLSTNLAGTISIGDDNQVRVLTASNTIGGTTASARNLLSVVVLGPGSGTSGGNSLLGNYVGVNVNGSATIVPCNVSVTTVSNTIGGTTAGSRNVVAAGVNFDSGASGNLVQGNYIGTDPTGTAGLSLVVAGTGSNGIRIVSASNNTIGGTSPSARNVIAGQDRYGILIAGQATQNLIQGNYIGTNLTATVDLGNKRDGVAITSSLADGSPSNNAIGGVVEGARNVVSGNDRFGVAIHGGAGNSVQGNNIGTDANGLADLGNGQNGVIMTSNDVFEMVGSGATSNNTIGGTDAGARNVISGNGLSGVLIEGTQATGNFVQSNFIGTNAAGTAALGNDLNGVTTSEAPGNTIGGSVVEARNIISANARHGVSIGIDTQSGSTGITVRNNYIGTDVTGNACLGNQRDGVFVNRGSVSHTISDNLITCNARNGVNIPNFATNDPGIRIEVTNNSIFANALLGIDLGDAGITANDAGDPDGGANFQQNFPVLTSFVAGAQIDSETSLMKSPVGAGNAREKRSVSPEVVVTVNGTLNSAPNTTFTVHWYFSGDSQCVTNQPSSRPLATGKIPGVTTNSNGNAAFNIPLDLPVGVNNGIVNCTATDPQGNTSEFSACLPVSQSSSPPVVQFSSASYGKSESGPSTNITVARTGDVSGPAAVNFSTGNNSYVPCNQINGVAVQNCDFILSSGTLNFAPGQTSRSFPIIIVEDLYVEGNETINLTLSGPSGAMLGTLSTATLTLVDNDSGTPTTNPLDDPQFYVRQHYYDFLGRLPDDGGLAFWTNEITQCGTNTACINERRVAVSNAFFYEQEYQQTASYVFLLYRAAYGNDQPFPNPDAGNVTEAKKLPRYLTFVRDRAQVVGGSELAQTQLALANAFVQRPEFTNKYPVSLSTGAQFVDAVLATILNADGATLAAADRNLLITHFSNGGRGLVMFHLANDYWNGCHRLPGSPAAPCVPAGFGAAVDNRPFIDAEYNRSFVYSQYSGYLRRDGDINGFLFWLTEVSKSPPRNVPRQRAMVCSFVTSTEYQHRLSPVATHNNGECPPPP